MQRLFVALAVTIGALTISRCKKEQAIENTPLTGTWIKGINAGDTLYFTQTNGKHVLRYNASFNAAFPAVTETEYHYQDGKLSLRNFYGS